MKLAKKIVTASLVLFTAGAALTLSPVPDAQAEVLDLGWPYPHHNIDPYRSGGGVSQCQNSPKPGVVRLKDWLNFWYGNHQWGIARDCSSFKSKASYHHEGRALDYHVNYGTPEAESIINFMLKTDEYGNQHANARRWGIAAIHYGNKRWDASKPHLGLYDCPSCGPHYDHIHFDFSWAGANKQSSWFTTDLKTRTVQTCGRTITVKYWTYPSGYGPLIHIQSITGYGTYSSQGALQSSPWKIHTAQSNSTLTANSPVSALYTAKAVRDSCTVTLPG